MKMKNKKEIIKILKNNHINVLDKNNICLSVDFYEKEIDDMDIFFKKYECICTLRENDFCGVVQNSNLSSGANESVTYVYKLTKDQLGLCIISLFRNLEGRLYANAVYNCTVMI